MKHSNSYVFRNVIFPPAPSSWCCAEPCGWWLGQCPRWFHGPMWVIPCASWAGGCCGTAGAQLCVVQPWELQLLGWPAGNVPCEQSCPKCWCAQAGTVPEHSWHGQGIRLEQTGVISIRKALTDTENLSKRALPLMTWSFGVAAVFFHPYWGDLPMSIMIVRWMSVWFKMERLFFFHTV